MTSRRPTTRQIKAARALLRWSQETLALSAGVAPTTLKRLEAIDGELAGRPAIQDKIVRALEEAGIELIDHSGVRHRKD